MVQGWTSRLFFFLSFWYVLLIGWFDGQVRGHARKLSTPLFLFSPTVIFLSLLSIQFWNVKLKLDCNVVPRKVDETDRYSSSLVLNTTVEALKLRELEGGLRHCSFQLTTHFSVILITKYVSRPWLDVAPPLQPPPSSLQSVTNLGKACR